MGSIRSPEMNCFMHFFVVSFNILATVSLARAPPEVQCMVTLRTRSLFIVKLYALS